MPVVTATETEWVCCGGAAASQEKLVYLLLRLFLQK